MFGLGPFPADDPYSAANLPAGYLSSTAEDLSHYMLAQLNGGRYGSTQILSAAAIARMHQAGPNTQNFNPSGGYGLGWGVGVSNGVRIVDHTGETMKFVSRQFMDIDNGWGLIVLTNASNPLPSDGEPYRTLARGLITRIEGWPPAPAAPSIHTQYAVLDVVLAVLSVAILVSAARLPRWNERMQGRLRAGVSRLRLALIGVRIAFEIAIPVAVLLLGPSLMQPGISSRTLLVSTPDIGWWALYFSGLLLITALTRGVLLGLYLWRSRGISMHLPALKPSTVTRSPSSRK